MGKKLGGFHAQWKQIQKNKLRKAGETPSVVVIAERKSVKAKPKKKKRR